MSVTEESEHFFRISLLLLDTGGKTFRRKIQCLPTYNNFKEFLSSTKHVLYHLWRPARCRCPPQPVASTSRQQCSFSGKQHHLHKTQWDSLYRLQTGICSCRDVYECTCLNTEEEYCICAETLDCPCVYHPIPGVDLQKIDLTLAGTILRNTDLLPWKEKEIAKKIMDLRNQVYGHREKAALNDLTFNKYWTLLSTEILNMADTCNDRSFYTEITTDILNLKGAVLDVSNTERISQIWKESANLNRMITDEQREIKVEQRQLNRIIEQQFTTLRQEQNSLNEKYQDVSFTVNQIGANMVTKSDIKGIKRDMKKLKRNEQESCFAGIARNLISNTSLVLEKQKTNIYIRQSYVFEEARDRLTAAKVLVLSGIGGRGKTSMAHELMLEVSKKNPHYSAVAINEPTQWDEVVDGNKSLIVLIDDIFGKTNLDDKCLSAWEKRFESMWACSSKGKVLLIIGCRSNILEEGNFTFEKYDLFKGEHILDLSSPRYELDFNDKLNILHQYCERFNVQICFGYKTEHFEGVLSHDELNIIASTNTLVGFPQLCNLFFTKPSFFKKGIDFFIHASDELVKDISSLRRKEPTIYGILLYIVLKNNSILINDLNVQLMMDICKILKISTLDCTDIQELVTEQPLNTYLERSPVLESLYQFKHITILEAVLISVSKSYPEFLLKNADPDVVFAYLRSSNYTHKFGEISVSISAKLHDLLAKRLVDEKDGNMHLIIWHPSLSDPQFVSTVVQTLYESQTIVEVFVSCCNAENVTLPLAILEFEIRRCKHFNTETTVLGQGRYLPTEALKRAIVFSLSSNHFDLFRRTLECYNVLSLDLESLFYITLDFEETVFSMYTSVGLLACVLAGEREVKYLITETKINIDVADLLGNTMLHYSAACGWNETVELLLQKSSNLLNCVNKFGETPVLLAARVSSEQDIVLFLMEYDPVVSVKNKNGNSVVHYAAMKGWIDVIKRIRNKCPSILSEKNDEGNSPIIFLMKNPFTHIQNPFTHMQNPFTHMQNPFKHMPNTIKLLVHLSNVCSLQDRDGNSVLHHLTKIKLSRFSDVEVIGKVLEKHSSLLNHRNNEGETPLIYAAKHRTHYISLSSLISDFPTDLSSPDHRGNNVLHYLAFNGWIDLIDLVLQKDSSVINRRNLNGQTPILFAYTNTSLEAFQSIELLRTFLRHGVDMKICDNNNNSILHYVGLWACSTDINRCTTIEKLLSYDRSLIFLHNKLQQIPFVNLVCRRTFIDSGLLNSRSAAKIVNLLVTDDLYSEDGDQNGNTLLHYICRFGILSMEMKALPQMSLKNIFGMEAIMYAACYGVIEESTVAANLSDDICLSVDHFGRSILHYCALNFWTYAVRLILMKYKYKKNLADKAGDTPLMLALKHGKMKDGIEACETVLTLLKYKETVHVNEDGDTLLHLFVAKVPYITQDIIKMATEADPNCLSKRNSQGHTPFMMLVRTKMLSRNQFLFPFPVKSLIPKDLYVSDNDGNSVCHYCVFHDIAIIVEMVQGGCTNLLNKKNGNEETPFLYAAKHGKGLFVISRLLENADLRCSDLDGNTLLHFCLINGWTDIAEDIAKLDRGLLNYQNRLGQTPLISAFFHKIESEEQYVARSNSILRMLDFSPNLQLRDFAGNTLLHYSAASFCFPHVKKILGEDSNCIRLLNYERQSPTMFMMNRSELKWENAKPVLNFMLKFERRLDRKDLNGADLFQYCSKSVVQTYIHFSGCLTRQDTQGRL